ncbi:disulfide bond formation protein B [Thiorhodococcus minor]|uniref:Disulfide bond formation protein B n=1 Tax=Thiorhodococcus minor TaxID=57489 RepID=A0A6M0K640_9GAMM|nr:disulfide bond formation protein B [Thiorhodococcus minor]NEV65202.1 disulfide bond formation protein B [Thiorhodococcus minor]
MASTQPWRLWLVLAAGTTGIGLGTVLMTDILRLDPCHLCIFQRLLMLVLGTLAMGAALSTKWRAPSLAFGTLAILTALAGAATAAHQSWIQLQPVGEISCAAAQPGLIEIFVERLGELAPSLFLATGFCDDDDFRILGLTLANWSFVCFGIAAIATSWALRQSLRHTDARAAAIITPKV